MKSFFTILLIAFPRHLLRHGRTLVALGLLIAYCLLPSESLAQSNNCLGAIVVCSDDNINLNPIGPGIDDFANPNNIPGCLIDLEKNSSWFYFEIDPNAPPSLILGFVILPNGGFGEDYDWALYGPDVRCNNLGAPLRCSSSSAFCDFCPETGMGNGTTDVSEGPGSGDGFVMALIVEPGQGFFLLIDNWQGSHKGFKLTWTGTAAPFLNCNVVVPCGILASAGPDINTCGGEKPVISLHGSSTNNHGTETYSWSGTNGGTGFLSDPNNPNADIHLPSDFTGAITYTLTVEEDSCKSKDNLTIVVSAPEAIINPAGPFCESALPQILSASPAGGIWGSAVTGNIFDPIALGPGIHTVTYTATDSQHCVNTDSINIEVFMDSGITIGLGQDISLSLGETTTTEANTNFSPAQIDTIIWSPQDDITCLDPKCLSVLLHPINDVTLTATVFDINGCTGRDELQITVTKDRRVFIPTVFSPNHDGINDIFTIAADQRQITRIKKFEIYNRWGAIVHHAVDFLPDDLNFGWTGVDDNGIINHGVYVYLAEIEFIDGVSVRYMGDVTVIQ
ncbi:MAG: gliding motility-associated C-terminal domain-containing protein [Saprospiraceae bacterium]|uniref:Gliding motility-associated C-terminal domain-containing protein n=1 Tax=Candidatus Opimibacter skivensis TaxID=2982028 RepID=A0A9D7SXF8_9BACT|nr:gliding motility-associated C-terminal domain-containing protein [Candidatus Opimibacter skivensis]